MGPETLNSMYEEQYPGIALDFGHQMGLGWMLNGLGMDDTKTLAWHLALRALKLMREAKYGVAADLSKPKVVMPALVKVPEEKINRFVGYYSGIGKAAEISKCAPPPGRPDGPPV